jgi:hypothetical protein
VRELENPIPLFKTCSEKFCDGGIRQVRSLHPLVRFQGDRPDISSLHREMNRLFPRQIEADRDNGKG